MTLPFEPEDYSYETENRIKNLMWTVSGDYGLDTRLDVAAFSRSRYISLYDAVKQGAFARFFDRQEYAMYLVKKLYLGAREDQLMQIAQLCVDAAAYPKIAAQRPGVEDLRKNAFDDLLEYRFARLSANTAGRLALAYFRGVLEGDWTGERRLSGCLERIRTLALAGETRELIRIADEVYNILIDPGFEKKHGGLEQVLAVTMEELHEFDWKDFLEEESLEQVISDVEKQAGRMNLGGEEEKPEKEQREGARSVVVLDKKALEKVYSYMELNYGRSYLTELEQRRINSQLCRGAHADCSLYYTDGILVDTVRVNAQYVNAKRHMEKNLQLLHNSRMFVKKSVDELTGHLRRSLRMRTEQEQTRSDYGQIVPSLLWRVGRTEEPGKLFMRTSRRSSQEFVVDILMDASGSQRDRQSQVALQAYILSEALSNVNIPHRIMSFCTFWDYTVMQRYREYDAPRSENKQVFRFSTSANNRDGLAIRAAGASLAARPEENKILIVLSDGRPNDVVINRPGSRNPRPYYGDYAVKDTAFEVRGLRNQGIFVLGVFAGREKDLAAEKQIFGRDFAYIRTIGNFANVAGKYLRRLLEWKTDEF